MKKILIGFVLAAGLVSACAGGAEDQPPAAEPTEVQPVVTQEPEAGAEPAPSPTPVDPTPAFEARTYRDEEGGYAFEYPTSWDLPDLVEESARGSTVQFSEGGEPVLEASILSWDPSDNLTAYGDARETAWLNSEFVILEDEKITLSDGTDALRYLVRSPAGDQALFLITEVGDRYLVLSGSGQIELLRQISASLRLLENES